MRIQSKNRERVASLLAQMARPFCNHHFALFVVFSGFAAAVNIGSRVLFQTLLHNYIAAIILSYLCGMAVSFLLNKNLNFEPSRHALHKQMLMFVLVNVLGLMQTLLVSVAALDYLIPILHIHKYRFLCAHILGMAAPSFTSFIGHRYFTFGGFDDSDRGMACE